MGFGIFNVDEFDITADEIFLSTNTARITKNGDGTSNFNGDVEIFAPSGSTAAASIEQLAGTINFNGTFFVNAPFVYNGDTGTTTNFNAEVAIVNNDPLTDFTFGSLNAANYFLLEDLEVTLFEGANFIGPDSQLVSNGTFLGGTVSFQSDAKLRIGSGAFATLNTSNLEINGGVFTPKVDSDAVSDYDSVNVTGTVSLTDATFNPGIGFIAAADDQEIILINNDGTDPVAGTFDGFPEGSIVSVGEYTGYITYEGGDGNDVSLIQDTTPPVAVCSDLTLAIPAGITEITGDLFDGGSTDNVGIASYLINGEPVLQVTLDDLGNTAITLTVIDVAGNTDECTATLTLTNGATLPIQISEYQPEVELVNSSATEQILEISGAPDEPFAGFFTVIEGDLDSGQTGLVRNVVPVAGTFDVDGIFTVTIPNIANSSHTVVLSSSFAGTEGATDIDLDDDGAIDDPTVFGVIFDAISVVDEAGVDNNRRYADGIGGTNLNSISSRPAAIFRESSVGELFVVSQFDEVYDASGNPVASSLFDLLPTASGTFGIVNPIQSLQLQAKIFLQGAGVNADPAFPNLMRDQLRSAGLIPTNSPYIDGAQTTTDVLNVASPVEDAIVDWVWIEIRESADSPEFIIGKSALLQRDGDLVEVDGVSPIQLPVITAGNYYLVVQHRNHLGVRSANALFFSPTTPVVIDFTATDTVYEGGSIATVQLNNGNYALICGDLDGNTQIQNTDVNTIIPLLGGAGYDPADLDMNGQIQNADINLILNPNLGKGEQF